MISYDDDEVVDYVGCDVDSDGGDGYEVDDCNY